MDCYVSLFPTPNKLVMINNEDHVCRNGDVPRTEFVLILLWTFIKTRI